MCQYAASNIPPVNGPWIPCGQPGDGFCTSSTNLGIQSVSRLPGCWSLLDFTYFQCFVTLDADAQITTFNIDFTMMDDGSRITVFNSDYPNGLTLASSYVYLSQSDSVNMASYMVTGSNRIIITQVDDCAVGNNIIAQVQLDGVLVPPTCVAPDVCHTASVTGGVCNIGVASDGTACNDNNACTQTDSCQGGVCTGGDPVTCPSTGAASCPGTGTPSTCDPSTGTCSSTAKKVRSVTQRKRNLNK